MKTRVPLQFLVGLTRLISIYFGLRAVDNLGNVVIFYRLHSKIDPGFGANFPGIWAFCSPTLMVWLALIIATWFFAPAICRLALRTGPEKPVEGSAEDLNWGEIMIFLTGILLASWGISRIGDWAMLTFLQATPSNLFPDPSIADNVGMIVGFVILGAGGLLAVRFAKVYRWCQKRKATTTRPL